MGVKHGQFVWYDLMTSDAEAAKRFYGESIGWKMQAWDGNSDYTMISVGERSVGGIMAINEEMKAMGVPTHWLAHVAVDDVDARAKLVEELGGKILKEPNDIPEVGRFAVIADPQGAAIGIFAPVGEMNAHLGDPQPGDFTWHELNTTDWEAAWPFYEKLFGWSNTQDMDMGEEFGTYRMFKHSAQQGEASNGGFGNAAKVMGFPPNWLLYVNVDDMDAAVKRIEAQGGKLTNGPMDVPGGDTIAHFTDPQGGMFAVHWRNPNPPSDS
jgi:predicted enzyme related to lactoylglutathione lyase